MSGRVEFQQVIKRFGKGKPALDSLTLTIEPGEFLAIVGPSGCGKSTLLRLLAGLDEPTAGSILIDGVDVTQLPARDRGVAMVFQGYALYPTMTVFENIEFPLKMQGVARSIRHERVRGVANALNLGEFLQRRPSQLSGGQCQRVAIGRAIVRQPKVFLFDEPLSNLDPHTHHQVRHEIRQLCAHQRTTTIYVTHNQQEAMTMGNRVAILDLGRLRQCDVPATIYAQPCDRFVAGFVGSPPMNLIAGEIQAENGILQFCGQNIKTRLPPITDYQGKAALGIRPHAGRPLEASEVNNDGLVLTGQVCSIEYLGHEVELQIDLGESKPLRARLPQRDYHSGQTVRLQYSPADVYLFRNLAGVDSSENVGDRVSKNVANS